MLGASKSIWGFDPRSIPGCSIWFDAADTSTITTSGTNVTSWTNKGSIPLIAYPLTGGLGTPVGGGTNSNAYGGYMTSGTSTVNGLNAVSCPIQTTYGMNSTVTFPAQARAVFAVYKATVLGSSSQYLTFFGCATVTPNNQNGMDNYIYYDGQSATLFAEVGAGNGSVLGASTAAGTIPLNTTGMVCWVQSAVSTGSNFITLNGVSQSVTTNAIASTYVTTPQYYFIGCSYPQSCLLCEYIMINAEMTIPQRQSMEGYLARKWGITLPTTHPFYGTLPFNRYFNPTDIPGCSLWLDGADGSSIVPSIAPGIVTSLTGNMNAVISGVAQLPDGNIVATDSGGNLIKLITYPGGVVTVLAGSTEGSNNATGTSASFAYPFGVAVLSNSTIVVADANNSMIRLVTYPGAVVTTLAGNGARSAVNGTGTAATFNIPQGVAVLSDGNIVVADTFNNMIRLVTYPGGVVTTLAGQTTSGSADGTGTAASFYYPIGIAQLSNSNIVVVDSVNNRIRLVTYPGGVVTTLAGQSTAGSNDGTGTAASFNRPNGVCQAPNGGIIVTDGNNNRIRLVTTSTYTVNSGVVTTLAGSGTGQFADGTGTAASFFNPNGVAKLSNGNAIIADTNNYRIRIMTIMTTVTSGTWNDKSGQSNTMSGTATWSGSNMIFDGSTSAFSNTTYVFPSNAYSMFGVYSNTTAPAASAYMNAVYGSNGYPMLGIYGSNKYVSARSVVANTGALSTTVGWAARIGGTGTDLGRAVATDSSGNVLVTGNFTSGSLNFYNSSGVSNASLASAGTGSNSCFIGKYTSAGAVSWAAKIGGTLDDYGYGIATDLNGNVFVTGFYNSSPVTVYDSSGVSNASLANAGSSDIFLVKYTSSGSFSWAARMAGASLDSGRAVATDSSGNVFVAGHTSSLILYDSSGVSNASIVSYSAFVAKYTSTGSVSWVVGMGGTGGINVTIDSSGNVLVTGNFTIASLKFYNSSGVSNASISNSGSSDIFIAKYTSSGSFSWAVHIGGTGADYEYGVATDSSGNVFVTGSYASTTLTFYDSSGVSNASLSNSGVNDCFIAKYTSAGAVSWVAKIGGTGDDDGYGIATDLNGNVFVTGLYSAALTMYNTSGTAGATLGNVGGTYDGFVAKYTSAGAVSWAVQIAGAGADRPYGITTDSSGNVLVTGSYASTTLTFYDSSGVSNASLSTTGQNVFIAKYSPDGYITAPVPASSNVLVSATYASSTFSPFVNGSNTSTLAGATTATTGIYVGGPSNYFNGSISELLIYSSTLSAAQRQQVEGYLIQKWGLSTQTISNHPYKLIPPATSQPPQFAEVTPGNWTRDWNPYLQSLIAKNNPTNATVIPTVSYGTGGPSLTPALSTQRYQGGVLAPNGNIYCVPNGATTSNVLIINTTTNAVSYGTSSLTPALSTQTYCGGVLAPNGNIYCVPNGASNILIINTTTNAVSYGTSSLSPALSTQGYQGGVLAPNGNIYCVPNGASNILIINPSTNTVSYGSNSLTPALSGQYYYGGVLAPNGNIYCVPNGAATSNILIINTTTNAVSYGTSSLTPALSTQTYYGGVLAPNGNIYCVPNGASNILIINTTTNAVSYGTNSLSPALSGQTYQGGVLAPNGNIYCVPTGASNVLIINTTTNAVSYGTNSLTPALTGQRQIGGVLAPNGNIYCQPFLSSNILIISNAYTQNPSSNYCLSAYANKL